MIEISTGSKVPSEVIVLPPELNFLAPTISDSLMRVGGANDGGYVIPTFLANESTLLISLGLSDDWSFDKHFKQLNPDIQIHSYDHTVSRAEFQKSLQRSFIKACLGKLPLREVSSRFAKLKDYDSFFSGSVVHFEERVRNRVDRSSDVTIASVFGRSPSRSIFLKCDIEGSEYRIIDDILKYADRIIGIAIEFHDTEPLRQLFIACVQKLQQRFGIVHLHANNYSGVARDGLPNVLEITFAEKTRCIFGRHRTDLPIPEVDSPCNPRFADYAIHFIL